MTSLYRATVTGIGEDVAIIKEENVLIFFDENSPKELHDVAVLHKGGHLADEIKNGDMLVIGSTSYPIVLVGDTVNHTLRDLGHFTVNFTGSLSEVLPGSIYVQAALVPDLAEGAVFEFVRGN